MSSLLLLQSTCGYKVALTFSTDIWVNNDLNLITFINLAAMLCSEDDDYDVEANFTDVSNPQISAL